MTTEPQAQTSDRERLDGDAAHTAICQAVALLNVSIGAAVDDNARQAHTILRSYLADPPMLRADAEKICALEADAARYRWLRENVKPWEGFSIGYPYCEIDIFLRELDNGSVEKISIIGPRDAVGMASLDTAVDIARRTEPQDDPDGDHGPTISEITSGERSPR